VATAVLCIAVHQLHTYLLNPLPSSHAEQTVVLEEPFTSPIQTTAKVFCLLFVVVIVTQPVPGHLLA
jgi:hypothetical protein